MYMYKMILLLVAITLTGCSTAEQLAKNLDSKSLVGDGTYVKSTIGIDTETKTPTITTTVVDGSFADIKTNQNFFNLSVKQQSSIWNAEAKTMLIKATLQTKDSADMHNSIDKIIDAFAKIYGDKQ